MVEWMCKVGQPSSIGQVCMSAACYSIFDFQRFVYRGNLLSAKEKKRNYVVAKFLVALHTSLFFEHYFCYYPHNLLAFDYSLSDSHSFGFVLQFHITFYQRLDLQYVRTSLGSSNNEEPFCLQLNELKNQPSRTRL